MKRTWPYARGRAMLSTVTPLAVGGMLLRIRLDNRTSNRMGLVVGSAGLLVGPSVGQWCLVDCQGSLFRLCSDLKIPWQVAPSKAIQMATTEYFPGCARNDGP
jgi:hypothetical protein